ncbi:MAG: hypothetical protein Q3W99_02125, partial [Ruminococcus sp.]|nr:hypothetical protein [Ruminococcus sp.]
VWAVFSFEVFYQKAESFDLIIKKFRSSLFKGLRIWVAPIISSKITIYRVQTAWQFACLHLVWQNSRQLL